MFLSGHFNCILFHALPALLQFQSNLAEPFVNEIESRDKQQNECGLSKYHDSECGGVLEARDELQALSYRMERPKDHYESCLWTIHALNGGTIKINVTTPLYYSYGAESLAIGYFLDSSYDNADSLTWVTIPVTKNPYFVEVPSPVAFVHYLTEYPLPLFGFRLTYTAGNIAVSTLKFKNYFFQGEYGIFTYPPEGLEQRNNERVSIVLKVYPGTAVQGKELPSQVHFLHNGYYGCGSCEDENLNLFGYGAGDKKWFRNQTRCSNNFGEHAWPFRTGNDPIIFTFKSGANGAVGGFEIRWMNADY